MTGIMMALAASARRPLSVVVAPASMGGTFSNGANYSEGASATVNGGSGGTTYSWSLTANNFGFSISGSTTNSTCTVIHSGATDAERTFTLQCLVGDSAGGSASDSSNGSCTWGVPP